MTSPDLQVQSRAPRKGRRLLLGAASAVAHGAVLVLLALGAGRTPQPSPAILPASVHLDITPRPMLEGEAHRPPVSPRVETADRPAMSDAPSLQPRPLPLRRAEEDEDDARPSPAAPPSASSPNVENSWRYRPETAREGVGRALRVGPIGCNSHYDRLTPAEQALCDERFNERAAAARPLPGSGNTERDAGFARQGDRALARYEARRAPLAGGTGVVGPGDCPGSNFGTGCAGALLGDVPGVDMRQGARTIHTPSQKR